MLGNPHEQTSQSYRTLAGFVGTTQGGCALVHRFHKGYWRLWINACLLSVVMCLFPGEAFRVGTGLANAGGNPERSVPRPLQIVLTSERASSSTVGNIMALLATLEEAGVLPPEGTSQANQVIHGLIQLQSAVMKSSSPELGAYRVAAEAFWRSQQTEGPQGETGGEGLTSKVLVAFIDYDQEYALWGDPNIVLALQEFNVTRADWMLVADLFHQAEVVFREQGRSIHSVYEIWRMNMPGRKS